MSLARNNWVVFAEADEIFTPELSASIRKVFDGTPDPRVGYAVDRRDEFFGLLFPNMRRSSARHTFIRMFNRLEGGYEKGDLIHERATCPGGSILLDGMLLHWRSFSIAEQMQRFVENSRLEADQMQRDGIHAGVYRILLKPILRFLWCYVRCGGFRMGKAGLVHALMVASAEFIRGARAVGTAERGAPRPPARARLASSGQSAAARYRRRRGLNSMSFVRRFLTERRPARAAALTLVTQGAVILLNMGTGILTARVLGPAGRGVFAAVTLWPQFLSTLAVLGIPSALVYFLRSREPAERDRIISAAVLLALAASSVATLLGCVIVSVTMGHYGRDYVLLSLFFCAIWTGPYLLTVVLRQAAAAEGRIGAFNRSCYLPPLLFLIALLGTWALMPITPVTAAICIMLPSGLVLAWLARDLIGAGIWSPMLRGTAGSVREMAAYAWRAAPGDVVSGLLGSIDRLILVAMLAPAQLGIYAVAYSLSRLLLVMQTLASAVLFPQMAGRSPDGAKELHDQALRLVIYAVIAALVVVSIAGTPVLGLVYGHQFAVANDILFILVIEAGLTCAGQVSGQLFLVLNRPGWVSTAQGIGLASAGVALFLLVPPFGGLGAAAALAIAGSVRMLVLLGGIPARLHLSLPRLVPSVDDVAFVRSRML